MRMEREKKGERGNNRGGKGRRGRVRRGREQRGGGCERGGSIHTRDDNCYEGTNDVTVGELGCLWHDNRNFCSELQIRCNESISVL